MTTANAGRLASKLFLGGLLALAANVAAADVYSLAKAVRAKALAEATDSAIKTQLRGTVVTTPTTVTSVSPVATAAASRTSTLDNKAPQFERPARIALLVILENGGIVDNLDPAVRSQLNTGFLVAKCSSFSLEMRATSDLPGLITQIAGKLQALPQCLQPANWRFENYTLRRWVDENSDTMLENTVKGAQALNGARARYNLVEVFEDARATPELVMTRMRELAPTHVLDIHILTHGGNGKFIGGNRSTFNSESFFKPLAAGERALDYRLFIRSVYQMNCFSGSLLGEWGSLGAEVVNSVAANKLNSMPWQYMHFFGKWVNENKTFAQATTDAYNEAYQYTSPVYAALLMLPKARDSELTTVGDGTLTIARR